MLKKKRFFVKQLIKYNYWYKDILFKKLLKSFQENHLIQPVDRISFFIRTDYYTRNYRYYGSQNRLACFMTYSLRVPSKRVLLSRFYLNKGAELLYLSNYQK